MTAIVIDDNPKTVLSILNQLTHDVKIIETCNNLESAKQLIESNRPYVLFVNTNIIGFDCFELLNSINADKYKIIFISNNSTHALRLLNFNL